MVLVKIVVLLRNTLENTERPNPQMIAFAKRNLYNNEQYNACTETKALMRHFIASWL